MRRYYRVRPGRLGFVVAALLNLAPGLVSAQDSHYWTEQFGNRARLLGGAFIGGGTDISVVYYNPGRLATMEPELLLAGNAFQLQNSTVEPGIPNAESFDRFTFDLTPSLFAGQLKNEVAGGRIAFSFLTRTKSDFRLAGQTGSGGDAIEGLPDISFANTSTFIESRVGDYWIGATWARALGERVGLGVSTFFATRSQNVRIQNASTLLRTDNRVEASSQIRDFSFYNVRLLWKVGLSTDIGRWQLGLTVTTPSISLFGDGTSTFESTLAAPDDAAGNPQGVLAADRQQVPSEFRSPLSVGFGVARTFGSTGLYLATEWFQQVDPYTILDTEPFEAQSSGASLSSDVTHQLKSVTNVSIGVEHQLDPDRRLYERA